MAHEDEGAPTPYAPAAPGSVVAYRNATLIDGTGEPARTGITILVDGQVITQVSPDADTEVPDGAAVIDLTGRYVLPGLIDSHQHLATPPNRPVAEAALRRQVYGGVTAIRDMADDLRQIADLTRACLVGEIPGPDIHYAALMAGPGFFDDPRTWQVSQGETPGHVPWMQAIDDHTELPLAVAMARGTHATAIKVYADLPARTVAAITAEAHRQGIDVWAHAAVFPATPAEVVDAGVDAVSHVTLLAQQTAAESLTRYKTKAPIDTAALVRDGHPALDTLYDQMIARGTVLDATASMWTWMAEQADDDAARERALANIDLSIRLTADAFHAGVPVSTGTDYETDPDQPFPSLHEEMLFLWRRCGIPAEQVIRCATLVGAMSMGAADRMGTVEAGKLANLVVLAADPVADLESIRTVEFTVKRGRRYYRADYAQPKGTPA
ncbi:amidohydrolase family protein [Catellatospora sp. KI3]|uniref:amidohydrolase family protein n=1 Tax=Catellatospora sp. KI3 TaxID=3041620 RepID=UPI002482276D|nr:amidohydrolase family protein [Catellatospora sp. KI3]MDI1461614.1 amidohydrolase family protein [Catellatospora sp. KI3]